MTVSLGFFTSARLAHAIAQCVWAFKTTCHATNELWSVYEVFPPHEQEGKCCIFVNMISELKGKRFQFASTHIWPHYIFTTKSCVEMGNISLPRANWSFVLIQLFQRLCARYTSTLKQKVKIGHTAGLTTLHGGHFCMFEITSNYLFSCQTFECL